MNTEESLNYGGRVVRGYTGRVGCACGCRGKYTTKPFVLRRIVAALDAAPAVDVGDAFDGSAWRSAEVDGKVFTLYVESAQ